jgi:bromodomain-containing protein 7/9
LKLVIPALKAGKPAKGNLRKKGTDKPRGPPRPPKLKPLKEVLARLISQIRRYVLDFRS